MLNDSEKKAIYEANLQVVKSIVSRINKIIAETESEAMLADEDFGKMDILRGGVLDLSNEADSLKQVMDYIYSLKSL